MKKKLLALILALSLCLALVSCGTSNNDQPSGNDNQVESSQSDTSDPVEAEESTNNQDQEETTPKNTGLTEESYSKIENGMTYDEVVAILGEGEKLSDAQVADITTSMYQWTADDLSVATITFQDDVVVNKSQFGVSEGSDIKVTAEMYNQIQEGMTYDEVVEIFGGEGTLVSDTEISGITSQIYQWNGETLGSNCTITFSDGKVFAMSQVGLQ